MSDLDVVVAQRAQLLFADAGLVQVVRVHLLAQDRQGRLRGLADLLVHALCLQHNTVCAVITMCCVQKPF